MAFAAVGGRDGEDGLGGNDCGSYECGAVYVLFTADVTVYTVQEISSTSSGHVGSLG